MKFDEKQQENFVRGVVAFTVTVAIVFAIMLVFASALTILSVNALMASEIVPLTYTSVFALAWLKFVVLWFLNRVSIKRNET